MKIEQTPRGFAYADFKDRDGIDCSIQKSSLASEQCIWLGIDPDGKEATKTRMHLTQIQVADLLPLLQRFVATGSIDVAENAPPEPTDWRLIASRLDAENAKLAITLKQLQSLAVMAKEQRGDSCECAICALIDAASLTV